MSIIQAMYAGSSALNSFSESITVIGNNLANANTTAFKASAASFEDVLIQTVGSNGAGAATQVGTGVGLSDVQQDVTQGSFATTTNVTDLSIDGRGFFKVKTLVSDAIEAEAAKESGPRDIFYTRAGNFKKDQNGDLITPGGLVLQGWELDSEGKHVAGPNDGTSNINFTEAVNTPAEGSTLVTVGVNLDSSSKSPTAEYDPVDPATYNFSTSVRIFDSKGRGHSIELQFRKLPMQAPATAIGGTGVTSARQGAGLLDPDNATVKLALDNSIGDTEQVQVNITLTPMINGVPGTPIVADPTFTAKDNGSYPFVSTSVLTVGGQPIGELIDLAIPYNVSFSTTKQEIAFNLSEATDVELTFTPVNGIGAIKTAAPISLTSGRNTVDLRSQLTGADGVRLLLDDGVRYKISYTTTADVAATTTTPLISPLSNLVGDDSREEVKGQENDNTWEWHAAVKTEELEQDQQGPEALTAITSSRSKPDGAAYTVGQLVFDNRGRLLEEGAAPLAFRFFGAEEQEILFNFGAARGRNGDSTNDFEAKGVMYEDRFTEEAEDELHGAGSLQISGGFSTTKLEQNGFAPGFLDKLAIDQEGYIRASYTNGQNKKLFQITLYDFDDEAALEQKGSNLFAETRASGNARMGEPESGRLGSIVAFSLEQSNVDMSGEFVRMITTQRGFQANSRIVTVVDGMMEELMALKR